MKIDIQEKDVLKEQLKARRQSQTKQFRELFLKGEGENPGLNWFAVLRNVKLFLTFIIAMLENIESGNNG